MNNLYEASGELLLFYIYLEKNGNNDFSKEELLDALRNFYHSNNTYQVLARRLNEEYRFSLLNNLLLAEQLKISLDSNGEIDYFIYQNISTLARLLLEEIGEDNILYEDYSYSKIDINTLNSLIEEFLIKVDTSLEWLNLYRKNVNNGHILFYKKGDLVSRKAIFKHLSYLLGRNLEDNEEKTTATYLVNKQVFQVIELKGDIRDFWSSIHEFIHFIQFNKEKKASISKSLDEYAAIFYEMYALAFLSSKNYKQEEINSIRNIRYNDVFNYGKNLTDVFSYLMEKENGDISLEREKEISREKILYQKKVLPKEKVELLSKKYPWLFNEEEFAKKKCDFTIELLTSMKDNPYLYRNYSYIMGTLLAKKTLISLKEKRISLEDVKDMCLNGKEEDIFRKLGLTMNDYFLK